MTRAVVCTVSLLLALGHGAAAANANDDPGRQADALARDGDAVVFGVISDRAGNRLGWYSYCQRPQLAVLTLEVEANSEAYFRRDNGAVARLLYEAVGELYSACRDQVPAERLIRGSIRLVATVDGRTLAERRIRSLYLDPERDSTVFPSLAGQAGQPDSGRSGGGAPTQVERMLQADESIIVSTLDALPERRLERAYEATQLASAYDRICNMMLEGPRSNFHVNRGMMTELIKLDIEQNGAVYPLIVNPDARKPFDAWTGKLSRDARSLAEETRCEGPTRLRVSRFYAALAAVAPPDLLAWLDQADAEALSIASASGASAAAAPSPAPAAAAEGAAAVLSDPPPDVRGFAPAIFEGAPVLEGGALFQPGQPFASDCTRTWSNIVGAERCTAYRHQEAAAALVYLHRLRARAAREGGLGFLPEPGVEPRGAAHHHLGFSPAGLLLFLEESKVPEVLSMRTKQWGWPPRGPEREASFSYVRYELFPRLLDWSRRLEMEGWIFREIPIRPPVAQGGGLVVRIGSVLPVYLPEPIDGVRPRQHVIVAGEDELAALRANGNPDRVVLAERVVLDYETRGRNQWARVVEQRVYPSGSVEQPIFRVRLEQ